MIESKEDRFVEFLRRLDEAPKADTSDSAFEPVAATLNSVEDEFSGIPFNPTTWQSDVYQTRGQRNRSRPMTTTSPIESLAKSISAELPDATAHMDKPRSQTGTWFLDVSYRDQTVNVQWHEKGGFGISCTDYHGYGEAADEVYSNVDAARYRILSLLLSNVQTGQPVPMRLSDLRKSLGVSQIALARFLNIQQGGGVSLGAAFRCQDKHGT